MVKVVFFVGLRRSRARVGTGGVESDDRGITRELVSPSLGETESWIGVVQFVQSQPRDVGLSDSDITDTYSCETHDCPIVGRFGVRGSIVGAQGRSDQRPKERRGAQWRGRKRGYGPRDLASLGAKSRHLQRRVSCSKR